MTTTEDIFSDEDMDTWVHGCEARAGLIGAHPLWTLLGQDCLVVYETLSWFRDHKPAELVKATGLPRQRVYNALYKLRGYDLAMRVKVGLYERTPAPDLDEAYELAKRAEFCYGVQDSGPTHARVSVGAVARNLGVPREFLS